jgi:uncharacterized protein (DUF58 family)
MTVKARVIVEGALTGLHRARLRGSSVEFAEHKEYSPGDEMRHIDWKVFGKADRYYVKQFEQESELCCYLVLDASASMGYAGSGVSKLEYASHLVAALSYLLVRQQDRVGLTVFGDRAIERYVPPRARPAQLRSLLGVIEDAGRRPPEGDESLSAALDRVAELARKRRGLVVVASDLFDGDGDSMATLRHLRASGHDTAVFHTLDPDEIDFPFDGLTIFEALESEQAMLVDPASIRRIYQERMKDFLEATRSACLEGGIDYHLVPTTRPFEDTLQTFLAERLRPPGRGKGRR